MSQNEKNLKKDELSYLVELSAKILPKNLECLCKNCHARVTIENEHHLNRYENTNTSYDKFFTPIIDEEIIE